MNNLFLCFIKLTASLPPLFLCPFKYIVYVIEGSQVKTNMDLELFISLCLPSTSNFHYLSPTTFKNLTRQPCWQQTLPDTSPLLCKLCPIWKSHSNLQIKYFLNPLGFRMHCSTQPIWYMFFCFFLPFSRDSIVNLINDKDSPVDDRPSTD